MVNVKEYKKMKNADVDCLKDVLKLKQSFGDHKHEQTKEIISLKTQSALDIIQARK